MSIEGRYIRTDGYSAEIIIQKSVASSDQKFHIQGTAYWGEERANGPNIGTLNFSTILNGNIIEYSAPNYSGHLIRLHFNGNHLTINEENWSGLYGTNVNFKGDYKRTTK